MKPERNTEKKKKFYASNVKLMSKKGNSDFQEGLCWFLS